MDKFEPTLKGGGLLVYNTSLINREPRRADVQVVKVPANDIANELKNPRGVNMVALGAFVGATGIVQPEDIELQIAEMFSGKPQLAEVNLNAFRRGHAVGQASLGKGGARG
jgi:2-oxoglutarate ferredoxin oxidoreductase subunit gamma